jgi:alpha-amylase/alpha-mannosidase (GH57 family)
MRKPPRFLGILWSLMTIVLVLGACGPAPAATPTPTAPPSPTSTSAPIVELTATSPPTVEPSATSPPTAEPTPTTPPTGEEPLYLALVWHQHQPLYYKDDDGIYTRPWARAHATKDYYDMVAILRDYPDVHVTFNLTPVLIRQLDDLAAGAKDYYWTLSEIPASELSDDQKRFILTRFFDANWDHMIARYPRYRELLDLRGRDAEPDTIEAALATFSEQDFRDLQIWWNLAWFDPCFLQEDPLRSLVQKGRYFDEADKEIVFDEVRRVLQLVIPEHKELQDAGQIEVIVTPYAHSILPLLYATDLHEVGDPSATLPTRFSYPNDGIAQITRAVEVYESHYGRPPRGMWPAEGAVAQEIVKMVADAGFDWMASGEGVLAKSLGMDGFTRNAEEVVQEADALYRPYYVRHREGPPVSVVFRDLRLSDLIGFEYSGTPAEEAVDGFMARIEAIRDQLQAEGAKGPHLVSVILDGENAWEHYDNDGVDFLNALYSRLSESDSIRTVTPSEYLAMFPDQREIETLWPGAWFSTDYGTWIGEPEENTGWEYLLRTRKDLAQYDLKGKEIAPDTLAEALDFMYLAEGSDWFWWYGADQDSGNDAYFDEGCRALLRGVYESLGEDVPPFVNTPIIAAQAIPASQEPTAVITPTVDGVVTEDEWASAGRYESRGGAQARASDIVSAFVYGYDGENLYARVDAKQDWADLSEVVVGLYIGVPGIPSPVGSSRYGTAADEPTLLGFNATHLAEVPLVNGVPSEATLSMAGGSLTQPEWADAIPLETVAAGDRVLEMAIPFDALGEPSAGDALHLSLVVSQTARDMQQLPDGGLAQLVLPDLSQIAWFLVVDDPIGDDIGPGTYTYPADPVFEPGVFDLKRFSAGVDGSDLVFRFQVEGPINNVWGSGIGLSVQTFDVYLDTDPGAGTGARLMLEGRNAALEEGNGWDHAIWVEGWAQKVLQPGESGAPMEMSGENVKVIVDPAQRTVTLRVPLALFGEGGDPTTWGYAAALLSQEGFPSPGVRRVRDVLPQAEQWRIGGGPNDTNHTRILDLAWPADATPTQAQILSTYPSSQETNTGALSPDDFARLPMLAP